MTVSVRDGFVAGTCRHLRGSRCMNHGSQYSLILLRELTIHPVANAVWLFDGRRHNTLTLVSECFLTEVGAVHAGCSTFHACLSRTMAGRKVQ